MVEVGQGDLRKKEGPISPADLKTTAAALPGRG
jgi:hypothetical protein